MTDEQRIATIKKIYSILWHPETGFKAFWKQPENRNLLPLGKMFSIY